MGNFSVRFSRPGGGGGPKSKTKSKDKDKSKKDKGAAYRPSGESAASGASGASGASAAVAGEESAYGPVATAAAREERALAQLRQQLKARPRDLVLDQLLLLMPLDVNWDTLQALAGLASGTGAGSDSMAAVEAVSGARLGPEARAKLHAQERRAFSPDALAHVASMAVSFRTRHGPDKGAEAPLLPTRLFLVQENVAVDEYAGASEDPRPYTRLPGGGIRYVLRTEAARSVGRVRLYATASSATAHAGASSDSSGSPRRSTDGDIAEEDEDEDEDEDEGAAAERPADSGHESHDSARNSEDRGAASDDGPVSGPSPSTQDAEGDTRSPKDPLPPVPLPFATEPAQRPRLQFGPQHPEREGRDGQGPSFTPTQRRLSGLLPIAGRGANARSRGPGLGRGRGRGLGHARGRGRGVHPVQQSSLPATPPSASATTSAHSTPSTSRASENSDYGYGGSLGSGRVALGVGGHWPRPSVKYMPLRDGEIPFACFLAKDIKRSQIVDSDDEEPGGASGTLYTTRRYLRPKAYAVALGPPPGMETPITCRVRVALPQAAWPAAAEFKWLHRSRAVGTIQWPAPADVDKVRTLGCLLVPVEQSDDHEWEYAFPHAEAYLESRLSGLQVRVLLAAAALLRACAGRAALEEGDWAQWLRHALFWQCERDVLGWNNEERPGRALAALLETFYTALTRRRLACYFMPKLNLLAAARTSHVRRIQERLSRVRESLLIHSLSMARSLRALGVGATAPAKLIMGDLYKLLVTDDYLSVLNPTLSAAMATSQTSDGAGDDAADEIASSHSEKEEEDEDDREREWKRRARRHVEAERAANTFTEARRASVDSIDLQAVVARAPWDSMRRRLVLEQLANALWERARWAQARGWLRHARVCARQASRLARLLEETDGAQRAEAAALRDKALAVEAACDQARRDARRRQLIELRKTSRVRGQLSPSALEPGSPVVLVGDVEAAAAGPSATFAFPSSPRVALDDAAAGESGDNATAAYGVDDDAGNRRYSTIAEVHAEIAALRLAEEDEEEEEEDEVAKESSSVARALVHTPSQGVWLSQDEKTPEDGALSATRCVSARTSTSSGKVSRTSVSSKNEIRTSVGYNKVSRTSVSSNEARSSISSNEARSSLSSNNPRASAVSTNNSRSSIASNETRASVVSNNMRASIASNVTGDSVVSSNMIYNDTHASNDARASVVSNDSRASMVSVVNKGVSILSNVSRAGTVSNNIRASAVSNKYLSNSNESNEVRACTISDNARASTVSNDSQVSVSSSGMRPSDTSKEMRSSVTTNGFRAVENSTSTVLQYTAATKLPDTVHTEAEEDEDEEDMDLRL